MRSNTTLAMLGTSVLALTIAASAQAQPVGSDPGGAPNADQPASPGVSLSLGGPATPSQAAQDTGPQESEKDKDKEQYKPVPWHGTVLIFDQSFTTQSTGIGSDYVSDNPVYEMNLSFRPRYYLYEGDVHSFYVAARIEATRELTNSDMTTKDNETQLNNTYLDAMYGVRVYKKGDWATSLGVGPRFVFPTDKYTYRGGNRLRLGGGVKAAQSMPLAGGNSTWFPSASLQASAYYLKYINAATTSTNPDFERLRQDGGGRTLVSDQFGASAKVSHEMTTLVGGAVDVTSALHLSASYIWITQWTYGFGDSQVDATTGPVTPNRIADPQTNRVIPYFMAGIDYDVIPEMGLGAGYYNATNQIGPEGTRRSPFWSPEARIFFDVTANLDEIYNTAAGRRSDDSNASGAAARQQARISTMSQGTQ